MVQEVDGLTHISGSIDDVTDNGDYVTITPAAGSLVRLEVAEGATVENVLFDQRQSGAGVSLWAMTGTHSDSSAMISGYTIRNIAWRGGYPEDSSNFRPLYVSSVAGEPEGLVENVYMGDGIDTSITGPHDHIGGGFYARASTGHVTFRNAFIEGWGDNGVYWSSPGDVGNGGTCTFENIRSQYNHVGDLRSGGDGDEVYNCCVIASMARGYWFKNDSGSHTVDIHDSVFIDEGAVAFDIRDGQTVNAYNTVWESEGGTNSRATINEYDGSGQVSNAEPFWPEGAPQTWEEAVTGTSGGGGGTDSHDPTVTLEPVPTIEAGDTASLTATITNDHSSEQLDFTGSHSVETLGTLSTATDYVNPDDDYSHGTSVDYGDFEPNSAYTWEYTAEFPNDDIDPITESTVISTGDIPTGTISVNHGDGNGEQEITNIPGISRMAFKRENDDSEVPVLNTAPSYDYDYGWDARDLQSTHSDGDTVTVMNDPAGGADASQSTSTYRPEFSTSGNLPVSVDFATNDHLETGPFPTELTQPYTLIGVFYHDGSGENNYGFQGPELQTPLLDFSYNGTTAWWTGVQGGINAPMATGSHVFVVVADGSDSYLRIDDYETQNGSAGDLDLPGLTIGANGNGEDGFGGELGTLQAYNRHVSDSEVDDTVSSLAADFALPMDYSP